MNRYLAAALAVVTITVAGVLATFAHAEELDDSAKWHVGDTGVLPSFFCDTAKHAAAGVAAIDPLLDEDGRYTLSDALGPLARIGCAYAKLTVTFVTIVPQSKIYVDRVGNEFAFVEWDASGVTLFSWANIRFISNKPPPVAGIPI